MMIKLRTYAKKVGHIRANEAGVGSCGAFNSKTMMVMRMAMTPSLNASSRFVLMRRNVTWASRRNRNLHSEIGLDKSRRRLTDRGIIQSEPDWHCCESRDLEPRRK